MGFPSSPSRLRTSASGQASSPFDGPFEYLRGTSGHRPNPPFDPPQGRLSPGEGVFEDVSKCPAGSELLVDVRWSSRAIFVAVEEYPDMIVTILRVAFNDSVNQPVVLPSNVESGS